MTKDDWNKAEQALSEPYGRIGLKADGYDLTVIVVPKNAKSLHYELMIYVNGEMKNKWIFNDCEIRRKFLCKHKRSLLTKNDRDSKAFKKLSKADREKIIENNTFYAYSPYFGSFRTLKSQLVNNNQSIELVEAL